MNREELEAYILNHYENVKCCSERLWMEQYEYCC